VKHDTYNLPHACSATLRFLHSWAALAGWFLIKNYPWGTVLNVGQHCALHYPERLPSGVPKEEFGWMILEKNIEVQSKPSAAARGGEAWRRNVWWPMYIRLLLQLRVHSSLHKGAVQNSPKGRERREASQHAELSKRVISSSRSESSKTKKVVF